MDKTTSPAGRFIVRITDSTLAFALRRDGARDVDYEPYAAKAGMSVAANLREAFHSSRLLGEAKDNVTVMLDAPLLLVPIDDYSEGAMEAQYRLAFPEAEGFVLRAAVLPSPKTVAVFAMDKDLCTVLGDHFEHAEIEPVMARTWDYLLRGEEAFAGKKLHVYFHDGKIEICSFSHRRFVFANTFAAGTASDAAYFILGAWRQINANAETDSLIVSGDMPERGALLKELRRFVRQVSVFSPADGFADEGVLRSGMPLDMMMQFV
ncbi:MAG: DUF3822 family protein [Prevotella sp.]|nr:DUF3822 family protein [Prevotella sp.]